VGNLSHAEKRRFFLSTGAVPLVLFFGRIL
jgi:hypothetical protein